MVLYYMSLLRVDLSVSYVLGLSCILRTSRLYINTQEKSLSTDHPSLARVPTVSRRSGWASPKRRKKRHLGSQSGTQVPSPHCTVKGAKNNPGPGSGYFSFKFPHLNSSYGALEIKRRELNHPNQHPNPIK